jgi:hypothetical protein
MLTTRTLAVIEAVQAGRLRRGEDLGEGEGERGDHLQMTEEVEAASLKGGAGRAATEALAQVLARLGVTEPDPVVTKEAVAGPITGTVWERIADEDGELYYNHTETGETTWDAPEEVIAAEESQAVNRVKSPRPESPKPAAAVQKKEAVEGPIAGTPWERVADADGDLYFNHTGTAETTWDTPEEVTAAEAAQVAVAGSIAGTVWEKVADEDGDLYYNNTVTGETTWDTPTEVLAAQHKDDQPKEEPLTVEPVEADDSEAMATASPLALVPAQTSSFRTNCSTWRATCC